MSRTEKEWQERYTKMSIFYQERLNHVEDMLEKSMEMNKKLVDLLGSKNDNTTYLTKTTPTTDPYQPPFKVTCNDPSRTY